MWPTSRPVAAQHARYWLLSALACSLQVGVKGRAIWSGHHTFFDPTERTLSPPVSLLALNPPILDPKKEGSFARHTLKNRLPAVCERLIKEGGFKEECASRLRSLAAEIPAQPLVKPCEIQEGPCCSKEHADWFNAEWASWLEDRVIDPSEEEPWAATLPLISTEMYLYRRVLDATGFFEGEADDPYAGQKDEALASALKSKAFLKAVKLAVGAEGHQADGLTRALILADLWGNQGDLALAPLDHTNTGAAERISGNSEERLLVDEVSSALEALESSQGNQVDIICDNAGVELLCDLILAFHLVSRGKHVVLHVKGEPLFISDAMPRDVEGHLAALEVHSDESVRSLGASLRGQMAAGSLLVESHMFWTAPRLFWEMPQSLSRKLAKSSLVVVKGDANFRRLVGDRVWAPSTPLSDVVQPWFPAPMLALRTLKAEIAVGMQDGMAESLSKEHKTWMTDGEWATAQYVPLDYERTQRREE